MAPWLIVAIAVVLAAACDGSGDADPFTGVAELTGDVCGTQLVASAVLVDQQLLITASHNVAGAVAPLTIRFEDGSVHEPSIVGFDPVRDIAALRIDDQSRMSVALSDDVTPGGEILRLSDLERTAVSHEDATSLAITGADIYGEPATAERSGIRAVADIAPGFSGGPLVNTDGEMIGMVFAESQRTGYVYGLATGEIETFLDGIETEAPIEPSECR